MLHKANPLDQCNLKFSGGESEYTITGYLAVWNKHDSVNDLIQKGAMDSANGKTLPLFFNHQHRDVPLGSMKGESDNHGFLIQANINPDHPLAKAIHTGMKRGDINGLSQGFTMQKGWYVQNEKGGRDISRLELKEGSIVTFPCEPSALITSVKQELLDQLQTVKDLEDLLREEGGFSKSMACAILSHARRILAGEPQGVVEQIKALEVKLAVDDSLSSIQTALSKITL